MPGTKPAVADTENWTFLSPEHEARCIEKELVTLQYDDRRTDAHYALMQSLRDSLSALRASAVTQDAMSK